MESPLSWPHRGEEDKLIYMHTIRNAEPAYRASRGDRRLNTYPKPCWLKQLGLKRRLELVFPRAASAGRGRSHLGAMSKVKGTEHFQDLLAQVSAEYLKLSSELAKLRGLDLPGPVGVTSRSDADLELQSPSYSPVPKSEASVKATTRENFGNDVCSVGTLQNVGNTVARKVLGT